MTIILIGYMGAGKSTLGKALSANLGLDFCDLDRYIEQQTGHTIHELFEHGEAYFREIEKQMLHKVLYENYGVLAVGGGTPCFFDNIEYMNRNACTIYLRASVETLKAHIRMGGSNRPLVDGKTDSELESFIRQSLSLREPYYLQSSYSLTIDTITSLHQIDRYVEELTQIVHRVNSSNIN